MASVVPYIEGLGFVAFLDSLQFSATLARARLAMLPHLLVLPQRALRIEHDLAGRYGGYEAPLFMACSVGSCAAFAADTEPLVLLWLAFALEVPTLLLQRLLCVCIRKQLAMLL